MEQPFHCGTIRWQDVRDKIVRESWAAEIAQSLRAGFAECAKKWPGNPPTAMSEWVHYYFCDGCGHRLAFDVRSPHMHRCPVCGKVYSGYPWDGSWVSYIHGAVVTNMERAAILAHTEPDRGPYVRYIRERLLFYAAHYRAYEIHGSHAGKGRVLPQSLTEAIFIVALERILRMTADLSMFTDGEIAAIGRDLFEPAVELLRPQIRHIHNHDAWLQAAVAACANVLNDRKMLLASINGEFGWLNQVRKGVADDGLWFEISPTYHYYSFAAFLSLAWVAQKNGIDLFTEPKFEKMGAAGAALAYDDGRLPAYNDGWFGMNLADCDGMYEQMGGRGSAPEILRRIYAQGGTKPCTALNSLPNPFPTPSTSHPRCSLDALLHGVPLPATPADARQKSVCFTTSGLGILNGKDLRVSLKCTPCCGWHEHYDKLAVDVFANGRLISCDPGTSGYGIDQTESWSRTSPAHNLVVLDGKRQSVGTGWLLSCGEMRLEAVADGVYEGAKLTRCITLQPNGFADRFQTVCDRECTIDWLFHCIGTPELLLPVQDAPPFPDGNGYGWITDVKQADTDGDWELCWQENDRMVLRLSMKGEPGTRIFTGKCPGGLANERLGIVVVRRRAMRTCFATRFTISGD